MFIRFSCVVLILLAIPAAADEAFEGQSSAWNGFDRYDFTVDGRPCVVVAPKNTAEGRPWIWRARFFGHEPQADVALLNEGFHLTYCDVAGLFGSPQAVAHWNAFYQVMTERHGLAKRPALEGMSRGGLIIYNWAAANPDKVACIYADAPVVDFKSWPGGKGKGQGGGEAWQQCLDAYGLSEADALVYKRNPIDNLEPLAAAGVPLLHVVGDADVAVPVAENTAILEQRYRQLGGSIRVIHKPGVGHHPHSLQDPGPIVAFVLQHTRPNVRLRGSLNNSRIRFAHEGRGHVAFIGGSITEMDGYRPLVCNSLTRRFPKTEFTFTNAGIASTCSTTGAFRLGDDVLSKGPVDLLFVEFAVNDDQDAGHARQECVRGMEGIVRQARRHNPNVDIVITHFVNPGMLRQLQAGRTPVSVRAHDDVARHYNVSTVHLAKEVAERITAGAITWQQFGGTHPQPFGNRICAEMIDQLLDGAWSDRLEIGAAPTPHAMPRPLDPLHYGNGRFIDLAQATLESGWEIKTPAWQSIPGSTRARFTSVPMLCAEQPGAALTLKFTGTAVGAYVVAGPDAAVLEARVDEGDVQRVNLYHRFREGLHYPRTVMFATDLPAGEHVLTLRISADSESNGHAARIIKFAAN